MNDVSPWLLCIGAFCVWPSVLFVAGFMIGRRGLPIRIERVDGWRWRKQNDE